LENRWRFENRNAHWKVGSAHECAPHRETVTSAIARLRVTLSGAVQGVGFRPFVYRLATEMNLRGWVLNSSSGLVVEVEGTEEQLGLFHQRLLAEKPLPAVVLTQEASHLAPTGFTRFEILSSDDGAAKTAAILPDLATCPACLAELLDPDNRRHDYPFTNCTNCGPRFTIILDIPYDRPRTTMKAFRLCPACHREYTDPADRRFHAQPNACAVCGPRLWLEAPAGAAPGDTATSTSQDTSPGAPLQAAAQALRAGQIVALKGIGGFQLLVDARNQEAVAELRRRKHREEKPFAVMMPSVETTRLYAEVSPAEEDLLLSPAAPIVLLRPLAAPAAVLAPNVAHNTAHIGVMLPYSPIHHLLMRACRFPIVATSGNRSDEPIATDNGEALDHLGDIASMFVLHDRPIARHCDDSVVRSVRLPAAAPAPGAPPWREQAHIIRRARGYAPLPVRLARALPPVLAVGAHLKNTVAIAVGPNVFLSQHIGDLDTAEARRAFENAIDDLCRLYQFHPQAVACDLHPDYASTLWARRSGLPILEIQHHQAHVAACAAENDLREPYLGVSWDGTGYGLDGTIWGGEFFLVEGASCRRVGHLRPFRLPGGEAAIREGWRPAAALLWELRGPSAVPECPHRSPLIQMLERNVHSPLTTSTGRLFDAVAALAGVADRSHFEGQAAMLLERALSGVVTNEAYPMPVRDGVADWAPLIEAVERDTRNCTTAALISARFHNALAFWIVCMARQSGLRNVVLSGGVFQNGYLVERAAALLEREGFSTFTHQRIPANDGGIALGQAVLAGLRTV